MVLWSRIGADRPTTDTGGLKSGEASSNGSAQSQRRGKLGPHRRGYHEVKMPFLSATETQNYDWLLNASLLLNPGSIQIQAQVALQIGQPSLSCPQHLRAGKEGPAHRELVS